MQKNALLKLPNHYTLIQSSTWSIDSPVLSLNSSGCYWGNGRCKRKCWPSKWSNGWSVNLVLHRSSGTCLIGTVLRNVHYVHRCMSMINGQVYWHVRATTKQMTALY